MDGFNYPDALIFTVSVLIAVSVLTRLMRARRNRIIAEVQQQVANEVAHRKAEAKRKKKQQAA